MIKKIEDKTVGSVLIVGAGIGGMQSALDLAESGFKVYLLDASPAIGGTMSALDKTFPTNDCAMCIMSPKLVECGRHLNIEIVTWADVESIEGKPGNFTVNVIRHPRYVDIEKCTGCGECAENCPVEVLNEFDEGVGTRHAIYRLYPQAIPKTFIIDKGDPPPCRITCPAGINVHGYVALISQGKFKEALDLIRERMPFPAICGRACHHPCEEECNRGQVDQPVAIRQLKRFVSDYMSKNEEDKPEPLTPSEEEKVAVIGAGPAGLTTAGDLLRMGYPVTVFDAEDGPGGMIRTCLPDYRIPKWCNDYDADRILQMGVELTPNTRVGQDISLDDLKKKGYKAFFVAIGAQEGRSLPLKGIDSENVYLGIPFLKAAKTGERIALGDKTLVIGGGNVAIDCARVALRLGSKEVHMVCLETRDLTSKDRMPAHDWEIEEAEEEGIILHPCLGPERILTENGNVTGLETIECTSVYAEDGSFQPQFGECSESALECDTLIVAIGQQPDFTGFENLETTPWKTFKVDEMTLETNVPGIFAGGDVASGPASVVEAVGQGHEAAISIDRYLRGLDLREGREKEEIKAAEKPEKLVEIRERADMPKRSGSERVGDFDEIELPYPTEEIVIEEAKRCLNCSICSECMECVRACEADAVDHLQVERKNTIDVGAVILSPGFDLFDATLKGEYGYGVYQNVITSMQFERILNASGPFEGEILRPSDGKHPKKIAFISCVGSRDIACGQEYCSSVCCMYSTKEAIIAKEHESEIEPTIFYMDMRAFGKGFDRYYNSAQEKYGIKYIRCMASKVVEMQQTKNLRIKYLKENNTFAEEEFELVILATGITPSQKVKELAQRIGLGLNEYGFCLKEGFSPTETATPGIFVGGAFAEPKDIPETVIEASSAAAEASRLLAPARGTLTTKKEYPEEKPFTEDEPRIGVFICRCGRNIGGYMDIPAIVEHAQTLPHVAFAGENLYTCSQDSLEKIKAEIEEHELTRVVVASCTPLTHAPLFRDTIREVGLNPYLFEMASLREHVSWVHMNEPEKATEKAKKIVAMAVAKAALLTPIEQGYFDLNKQGLILGGGLAGMTAALSLAEQGFTVHLVEKESELGGHLTHIYRTIDGKDVQQFLQKTREDVEGNELIHVYTDAEVKEVSGYLGNYTTTVYLSKEEKTTELNHGVAIIATGAKEFEPKEYLYGQNSNVISQADLEKRLCEGDTSGVNKVVMIQCVGSRDNEHPYCSRICCTQAVKNAIKIKEINADAEVVILYRDIRTYGFREKYYLEARRKGVLFIRYDEEKKPDVSEENGKIDVTLIDPVVGQEVRFNPDLLVLSTGVYGENDELAQILKLPLTEDGFFMEAHTKIRPLDFTADGMFLCGLAHSPRTIEETIAQAKGASIRAVTILSKDKIQAKAEIPMVNEKWCSGCGVCELVCPYDARKVNEETKIAEVVEVLCQGCGACATACPSGVTQQKNFEKEEVFTMIDVALT